MMLYQVYLVEQKMMEQKLVKVKETMLLVAIKETQMETLMQKDIMVMVEAVVMEITN